MVKGVIFDMDGLMFDTERLSTMAWKEIGKTMDFPISEKFILNLQGRTSSAIHEIFMETYGQDFPYEKARGLRLKFMDDYMEEYGVPEKDGLKELLSFLKANGIKAAVATSAGRERAEKTLVMAGVREYFRDMVTGDEVVNSKPNPEIFQTAARKLGLEPSECLVLEDSRQGVMAGKAAGGYIIHIPDMVIIPEEVKEGITAQMESLREVIPWLEKQNEN